MATKPLYARARTWATAFNKYLSLNQQLVEAPPAKRDALERAVVAQEELLLELPSPSFAALRIKMELLWDQQLEGLDSECEAKRLILEDLGDLIAESQQLLGAAS